MFLRGGFFEPPPCQVWLNNDDGCDVSAALGCLIKALFSKSEMNTPESCSFWVTDTAQYKLVVARAALAT